MAVQCFVHELIFVVVTVPHDSCGELGLVVADSGGKILKKGKSDLDNFIDFLHDWMGLPLVRVILVCTLLSGRNTTVLRNHLDEMGYTNVFYNGIAYSSLSSEQLYERCNDSMRKVARFFLNNLAIDTSGHIQKFVEKTNVYLSCVCNHQRSFTIAVGTIEHGVQVSQQIYYTTDICEILLPWLTKPHLYKMIIISNFTSIEAFSRIECALGRHCLTLKNLDREEMVMNDRSFSKFTRTADHLYAKTVLEEFIIQKRMKII